MVRSTRSHGNRIGSLSLLRRGLPVLAFEILSIRTLKSSHPSLYGKILERALELAGNLLTEHMDLTNPT